MASGRSNRRDRQRLYNSILLEIDNANLMPTDTNNLEDRESCNYDITEEVESNNFTADILQQRRKST